MFDYTQEELLEKLDKTLREISTSQGAFNSRQNALMQGFLVSIKNAVEKNKNVTVENIKREITNDISVKKPKWIDELKVDNSELEKRLQSVIDAIEKQEVVREVSIKEASWLTKALNKSAEKTPDYSLLLKAILKEAKKENPFPTKMKVTGSVKLTEPVSVKRPIWYKPVEYGKVLNAILQVLKKPLTVKVNNAIKLEDSVDVNLKNPVKIDEKLEVFIKDGNGRVIDFDRQFGRIGATGGSSGTQDGVSTEEKQDKIIGLLKSFTTNEIYENGTDTYFCKENMDGEWYIMKIDVNSIFTHATNLNNPTVDSYSDARTAVTILTYGVFNNAF